MRAACYKFEGHFLPARKQRVVRKQQCEFRWHAVNEPIIAIPLCVTWDVPILLAFLAVLPTLSTAHFAAMGGGHTGDRKRTIFACAPRIAYFKRTSEHRVGGFRLINVLTWSGCRRAAALGIHSTFI